MSEKQKPGWGGARSGASRPCGPARKRQYISKDVLERLNEVVVAAGLSKYKRPSFIHELVEAITDEALTDFNPKRRAPQTTVTVWEKTLELLIPIATDRNVPPVRVLENLIDYTYKQHQQESDKS